MTKYYALKRTIHYIRYEYCDKCCDNDNSKEFDKTIEHFEKIDNISEFVKKNKEFINPDMSLKVSYPGYQLKYKDYEGYEYIDCMSGDEMFSKCEKEGFNGDIYNERDYEFETTRIDIIEDISRNFIAKFE